MSTLSETAHYARKAIKYGAIAVVFLLVGKFAYGIFLIHWKAAHPPPLPPPEVKFGKIPKIKFPTSHLPAGGQASLSYRLQTIEGIPPNLPTVSKVYFIPQPGPNLLAADRAKERARKIGFDQPPTQLSTTVYRWQGKTDPPTTLELDIISGNFTLSYPHQEDSSLLINNTPSKPQAISLAKNFLTNFESLPTDLKEDQAEVEYLKFEGGKLTPAIAFSETQFLRVNLFRERLDDLSILPPNPKQSLISFLISSSPDPNKKIVDIIYTYNQIERETFSSYPLKLSAQAWQELQANQGYIANLGRNEDGKVVIRRIYLAFFESAQPQRFLQPIFVFEGDNDFYAYVAAVDPTMTE